MEIEKDRLYNLQEASQILSISTQAVLFAIRNRKIKLSERPEGSKKRIWILGENIIEYMEHKWDRKKSFFDGEPLLGENEFFLRDVNKICDCSYHQVYYLISKNVIPYKRKGNVYILNQDAVDYIQENKHNLFNKKMIRVKKEKKYA